MGISRATSNPDNHEHGHEYDREECRKIHLKKE